MEVADGIHRFGTRMVNWYLIERGGRLTLVDAGMRGYWPQLTHAHADHIGFAHQVKANSDATVQPSSTLAPPLKGPSWSSTLARSTGSGTS
jgi:hypothetical protein